MKRLYFVLPILALVAVWPTDVRPPKGDRYPLVSIPGAAPARPITPSPKADPTCDCGGPDLDCADFARRRDAQACLVACGPGDRFRLDADHDGLAYELWP